MSKPDAAEVNDTLIGVLTRLRASSSNSNAALNILMKDYRNYHLVLAVVGGVFFVANVFASVSLWARFRRTVSVGQRRWDFERKAYVLFATLGTGVALALAVIVAANVSTVRDPRPGFFGSMGLLRPPQLGTPRADLQAAYASWLQTGQEQMPAVVRRSVDDRVAWQAPKAVVCGALLIGLTALAVYVWRTLLARARQREFRWTRTNRLLRLAGLGLIPMCLMVMLMVMGNTQGALAPVSLTLFMS